MNLESPRVTVGKSAQELFDLLSDVRNFEKLMPENIAKFEVLDDDSFVFGLSGMPEIKLKMKEKVAPTKLVLGAASDKLPFTLEADINPLSENSSNVQLLFEGEFNAMMAMMIKGPIGIAQTGLLIGGDGLVELFLAAAFSPSRQKPIAPRKPGQMMPRIEPRKGIGYLDKRLPILRNNKEWPGRKEIGSAFRVTEAASGIQVVWVG